MSKPITIRGVEYRSMSEAAAMLGVSYPTIANAKKRGKLDGVGTGLNAKRKRQVVIRGVRYESVSAAADAYGTSSTTIIKHVRNGTTDELRTFAERKRRAFLDAEGERRANGLPTRRQADAVWARWLDALGSGDLTEMHRTESEMDDISKRLGTFGLAGSFR